MLSDIVVVLLAIAMMLARPLIEGRGSVSPDDLAVLGHEILGSVASRAGLTIGLAVVVQQAFPEFGASFRSLVIAAVVINELIGPVLFKWALDTAGESDLGVAPVRVSLVPQTPDA